MPHLFALCKMAGGQPDVDATATSYHGYVYCGDLAGQWGGYLFSGSGAQLTALNALASVVGIVAVTKDGDVRWAELDGDLPAAVRTKLNTWLTARGLPTIPTGRTNRQVVRAIFRRLRDDYEIENYDVDSPGGE